MNIVFLDIDGVISTPNYGVQSHAMWKKTNGWFKSRDEYGALFDPIAVDCLEYIVDHTNSKVVISSSWRKSGLQVMRDMFKVRGIGVDIIGITPVLNTIRGEEIEQWLSENDYVTNYLILDDDCDFTEEQLKNHFVCTKGKYGLNHDCLSKALKILMTRAIYIITPLLFLWKFGYV